MKLKIVTACFLLLWLSSGIMSESIENEYVLKTVFFKGFSRFITWPKNSSITDKSKPFIIGIIGDNPFGKIIRNVYVEHNRKIKDKSVEVRYIPGARLDKIPGCHILFISSSCENIISGILAVTRNKSILTIGDTEGYAEKGVLINFFIAEKKIRFEINESVFHKASLKVDSLLLREAKIVRK
jgi:hypothetical protein